MVEMACTAKVNSIVLLSGDGDFQSAVQVVREYNVNVLVVGSNISEMLKGDKNIKCIEIPDTVFTEIKNLLHVPEYKYSPSKFSEPQFKEKGQGKKSKSTLNKKESNSQNNNNKDVTGFLFKEHILNKGKNVGMKVDLSNSNSESISEHEAKAEDTHARSDFIYSDKFN